MAERRYYTMRCPKRSCPMGAIVKDELPTDDDRPRCGTHDVLMLAQGSFLATEPKRKPRRPLPSPWTAPFP